MPQKQKAKIKTSCHGDKQTKPAVALRSYCCQPHHHNAFEYILSAVSGVGRSVNMVVVAFGAEFWCSATSASSRSFTVLAFDVCDVSHVITMVVWWKLILTLIVRYYAPSAL